MEERDEGDFIRLDFVAEEREEKIEFNDFLENYSLTLKGCVGLIESYQ